MFGSDVIHLKGRLIIQLIINNELINIKILSMNELSVEPGIGAGALAILVMAFTAGVGK